MFAKNFSFFLLFLFLTFTKVECSTLLERSYEYVMSVGKNLAPSFMSVLDCMYEEHMWDCAKEKVGKILDVWDNDVQKQRRMWQEAADAEVTSTGRAIDEMPSQIGREVEESLNSLAEFVHSSMARSMASKKHDSGGIDSITISTSEDKKKMKKKKPKPAKIHLLHPVMLPFRKTHKKEDKGREGRVQSWVIGDRNVDVVDHGSILVDNYSKLVDDDTTILDHDSTVVDDGSRIDDHDSKLVDDDSTLDDDDTALVDHDSGLRQGRGVLADLWSMGADAVDAVAEHAIETENVENGIADKSSLTEQRGKKKKKKKAILKLLILGAVLKAKIGTLLQILSFKLQVKFFLIALIGLGINLARLWIDIKNKHNQQPQKVIYYEHAQHQHHYDHEEEAEHGWGPWSRSMVPEETDVEVDLDLQNTPYRAHDRNSQFSPLQAKV